MIHKRPSRRRKKIESFTKNKSQNKKKYGDDVVI